MTIPINSRFVWRCSFILAIVFLSLTGPAPASAQSDCTGVPAPLIGGVTWTPVFCDEFNGMAGSAPNALIWTYDTGNSGFGNGEIETYCAPGSNTAPCSTSNPNISLDGSGHLLIKAILTSSSGPWTSGRMKTQGLKDFQYGWIEARIQLPDTTNQGLWPAFWSLGSNIATTPWPACGEADILEVWSPQVFSGPGPAGNRSTIHTASTGGSGLQPNGQYSFASGQANNTALHAYGVIWSANMMQYYVDNPTTPFYVTTASDLSASDTWPFNAKIFLIMNVAVGGTLGGTPSSSTPNPGIMTVDYVRQYQPSAIAAPVLGNPPSITVKAGATTGNSSTFTPGFTPAPGYVYFTCSTNAPKASCSIATNDPLNAHVVNSAVASEHVTVSLTTTANALLPPHPFAPKPWFLVPVAIAAILLVAILAWHLRLRTLAWRPLCAAVALFLLALTIAACGGGSYTPPPPPSGTPPGAYTVTVYAFTEGNVSDGTNAHADANVAIPVMVN